jgi:cell division protein FtsB
MVMKKLFNLRNIIFIGIIVNLIVILLSQQSILDRNMKNYHDMQEQIQAETEYNDKLKEEQEMIGTYEYIERKAREKLGYVKKDEIVFINEK